MPEAYLRSILIKYLIIKISYIETEKIGYPGKGVFFLVPQDIRSLKKMTSCRVILKVGERQFPSVLKLKRTFLKGRITGGVKGPIFGRLLLYCDWYYRLSF